MEKHEVTELYDRDVTHTSHTAGSPTRSKETSQRNRPRDFQLCLRVVFMSQWSNKSADLEKRESWKAGLTSTDVTFKHDPAPRGNGAGENGERRLSGWPEVLSREYCLKNKIKIDLLYLIKLFRSEMSQSDPQRCGELLMQGWACSLI